MKRCASLALLAVLGLAVPASASAEESPQAEIRSSKVPVRGPWAKVKVACLRPEGEICNGFIGMSGVAHRIGEGKVPRLSTTRELSLLGGEVRPVAIRLLPWVWKSAPGGGGTKAYVSFQGHVGDIHKIAQLIRG